MSCTSCGHDPHAGACPRTITVGRTVGRELPRTIVTTKADLQTVPCPCVARDLTQKRATRKAPRTPSENVQPSTSPMLPLG